MSSINIPNEVATLDREGITADKLFDATTLILIDCFKTNESENNRQSKIKNIENNYERILSKNIVIWDDDYLQNALLFNYICSEVLVYDNDCKIYKLEKIASNNSVYKPIKSVNEYLNVLNNISPHKCSRTAIYGLEKYLNISVKKSRVSGFEYFPDYSSCCIYSPFTDKTEIYKLLNHLKNDSESDVKKYLHENISLYVPPHMIDIIKKYNINTDVSDDAIKEDYIELMYDFIKLKQCNEQD